MLNDPQLKCIQIFCVVTVCDKQGDKNNRVD